MYRNVNTENVLPHSRMSISVYIPPNVDTIYFYIFFSFTLYPAPSMVGRGKTFRYSHCAAEFWGYCKLSGGTQRRALPCYQSKKMKIFNIPFP